MFDRLEELVDKLDTINNQLTDPDVVSDQNKFRKLMKEQSDLSPIVEKYHEYKDAKTTIEDSLEILEEESDEELREMAKEEMNEAKANLETNFSRKWEESCDEAQKMIIYEAGYRAYRAGAKACTFVWPGILFLLKMLRKCYIILN